MLMEQNHSADDSLPEISLIGHRIAALAVHLFTASGAVLGLFALIEILRDDLPAAMIYMLVALAIDSIDGFFARRLAVEEFAPWVDGRRLDDIVDYLNFVIVPCVFIWQAGNVLGPAWLAIPVLASAFGFSQKEAKTDDNFFLGFPSYWNVLAFYLWLFEFSPLAGTLWIVGLGIAVFIPYKYVYPSRLSNHALRYFTSYSGLLWAIVLGWTVLNPATASQYHVAELSLAYPALYLGLSFKLGGLHRG
jgi:phosphatidylcholine synthase